MPDVDPATYNDARPYSSIGNSAAYITAAWDQEGIYSGIVPAVFTVGQGETSTTVAMTPGTSLQVTYRNVPLKSGTLYSVFVRYDIENEDPGATEVTECEGPLMRPSYTNMLVQRREQHYSKTCSIQVRI